MTPMLRTDKQVTIHPVRRRALRNGAHLHSLYGANEFAADNVANRFTLSSQKRSTRCAGKGATVGDSEANVEGFIDAQPRGHWAGTLSEIIDVLSAHNKRTGMNESEALKAALKTTLVLSKHFGGIPFYLPRGKRIQDALRHEEIYRQHNGSNGRELAERFGLTLRAIQKIVAAQAEINRKKRQGLANG